MRLRLRWQQSKAALAAEATEPPLVCLGRDSRPSGAALASEAALTMDSLVNAVQRVTSMMEDISRASHEQSGGIAHLGPQILLQEGVNRKALSRRGLTPFQYAKEKGYEDICALIDKELTKDSHDSMFDITAT